MTTIRTRVLPGGRIEITDPALREGAEVVVVVSSPAGDGASGEAPETVAPPEARAVNSVPPEAWPEAGPGGVPLVDGQGRPVFLPPVALRPGRSLVDLIGLAPSGRTAEEIDREVRDFRGDDEGGR